MKPPTDAERQQTRRDRLKAQGFTQKVIWVHKGDEDRLERFKETLSKPAIKDIRRRVVGSTWPNAFNVKNKAFPGVVFRIKFSTKGDLQAVLYDQLGREYLERHATGGTKASSSGGNLAIPINVNRTATGRIPKSKKPRVLTAKKSTRIVRGKGGKNLIVEKYKGETIVRYVLSPSAKIDKSFRFYEDATDTFNRVISGHWNNGMARALRGSRVFSG